MEEIKKFTAKISTDIFYACDSAGWYWNLNDINKYADEDNLFKVSAMVNNPQAKSELTINDYDKREKYYNLLKTILNYENCQ
jgi:predicted chitinase